MRQTQSVVSTLGGRGCARVSLTRRRPVGGGRHQDRRGHRLTQRRREPALRPVSSLRKGTRTVRVIHNRERVRAYARRPRWRKWVPNRTQPGSVPGTKEESEVTEATRQTATTTGAGLPPELQAVHEAAEAALETRAGEGDSTAAQQQLTTAAKAALDAGYALSVVAEAEATGQAVARDRLRKDVLRRVERSARKLREVTAEHETVVAQADELGLGAREIAERAGIAHGTVAAIVRRHRQRTNGAGERASRQTGAAIAAPATVGEARDGEA